MPKASTTKKQLNVRSDVAYHLAHSLARKERVSTQRIVEEALQAYADREKQLEDGLTVEQRAMREHLRSLGREFAKRWKDGEGSDHSDMYDEDGLPI
jgi:hypothetical protein